MFLLLQLHTDSVMLTPEMLPRLQRLLADADLDGWLLYDFRGTNAIAQGLLGFEGMLTRRIFALIPREGLPIGIAHAIEPNPWASWPQVWPLRTYSGWRALEAEVASLVAGKRIAMEYSAGDAIPYLDRVPAGVLEMVRAAGATVVSSGDLVSQVYATWTPAQRASHERAAEVIAAVARDTIAHAGAMIAAGTPAAEHELQQRILEAFARAGLETEHGPDVAASENAANPHYVPSSAAPRLVVRGDVLLVDLWARETRGGVYADQTWMASMGAPSDKVVHVWEAVRDARDAALTLLRDRIAAGRPVRGGEADDAARTVITTRGYGPQFWHRTGHSIDSRELHGSGPQIDNLESRDDRLLIPGVGFSIEPGVYIPGELGVRSEVNAFVGEDALLITPITPQRDLFVV
ncbi:M24 family metallopeptidase [Gemmatimonas aurantiaca]|uniref:M24 family metallopeptidase n=1 Tax=Gemmatimonas aurantiaca TaxID=173480 RepID=UPI001E4E12E1|nr:M24 family metallopeptidase [Gemmatimonas aurantiaca]